MEGMNVGKRTRSLSDGQDVPDAKRMRDCILDVLDEDDDGREPDTGPELVTVMKSLAEEIELLPEVDPALVSVSESAAGPDGSLLDLGYLLGASDDELGLPPTSAEYAEPDSDKPCESVCVQTESDKFDDQWSFDEFQLVRTEVSDGLFDYSDEFCDPYSEFPDLPWRGSEFLSAL